MKKKCIHAGMQKRGPYPNPTRERVGYKFKDDAAREKAMLRHLWYRRKIAIDLLRSMQP